MVVSGLRKRSRQRKYEPSQTNSGGIGGFGRLLDITLGAVFTWELSEALFLSLDALEDHD